MIFSFSISAISLATAISPLPGERPGPPDRSGCFFHNGQNLFTHNAPRLHVLRFPRPRSITYFPEAFPYLPPDSFFIPVLIPRPAGAAPETGAAKTRHFSGDPRSTFPMTAASAPISQSRSARSHPWSETISTHWPDRRR